VVSSGLLAWQVYASQQGQQELQELKQKVFDQQQQQNHQRLLIEELSSSPNSTKPQYIPLSKKILDQLNTSSSLDSLSSSPISFDNNSLSLENKDDLKSILPRHLRKPWRLLHQANTGDYEQHLKAVRDLSKLTLSDGECRQLSQSMECRTAIGLARTAGVDLRLFMPPPPLPTESQDLEILKIFRDILTTLPSNNKDLHQCIQYFTSTALDQYINNYEEEVFDSDISYEFHRESHHMHTIPRPAVSEETLVEHCLQALLSHSTVEEQCSQIVSSLALPLFSKIIETHPDNPRIKSLIGKILSNISLYPDYHKSIFKSGWVGILASWKQNTNLLVSLPATKALSNMDQEFGGTKFKPGIYLMLPNDRHVQHKNNLSNWGVDVVFIHGLMGGVFYTWRQQDPSNEREFTDEQVSEDSYSYCWPRDWLAEDSNHVRVIGCDFDSYISQWGGSCPTQDFKQNLEERSADMLQKLQEAGVGNRPVIFVGHSMGGLIIKKMLVEAKLSEDPDKRMFASNTKGVVFYGTPHQGSRIAKMNSLSKYFFFPSVEVQELEMGSPALSELNRDFKDLVGDLKTKVLSFGETVPTRHLGMDLTFVPPESSNPGVGEFFEVPFNHMDICKPASKRSVLFRKFYNLVWDTVDEASLTET